MPETAPEVEEFSPPFRKGTLGRYELEDVRLEKMSDALCLVDQCGFVLPWSEVEGIIQKLSRFYACITDEEIWHESWLAIDRQIFAPPTAVFSLNWSFLDKTEKDEDPADIAEPQLPSPSQPEPVPGYIYVLRAVGHPYYKIGRTKDITSRIKALKVALPFPVEVAHSFQVNDTFEAERHLHQRFAHCRTNGEWFALNDEDLAWLYSLQPMEAQR